MNYTISELIVAAEKFGLCPEKLQITPTHKDLDAGRYYQGSYNPKSDEITISEACLYLLVHEGWHRLVWKCLVPKMVRHEAIVGGINLSKQHPEIAQHVNQKNAAGAFIYPRGIPQREEYAAFYVENFFKTNNSSSRYLVTPSPRKPRKWISPPKNNSWCPDKGLGVKKFLHRLARQDVMLENQHHTEVHLLTAGNAQ